MQCIESTIDCWLVNRLVPSTHTLNLVPFTVYWLDATHGIHVRHMTHWIHVWHTTHWIVLTSHDTLNSAYICDTSHMSHMLPSLICHTLSNRNMEPHVTAACHSRMSQPHVTAACHRVTPVVYHTFNYALSSVTHHTHTLIATVCHTNWNPISIGMWFIQRCNLKYFERCQTCNLKYPLVYAQGEMDAGTWTW